MSKIDTAAAIAALKKWRDEWLVEGAGLESRHPGKVEWRVADVCDFGIAALQGDGDARLRELREWVEKNVDPADGQVALLAEIDRLLSQQPEPEAVNYKRIEDAGMFDNYTDAHRARCRVAEIDAQVIAAVPALLNAADEAAKLRAQRDALVALVNDWCNHADAMEKAVVAAGGRVGTPKESEYARLVMRARRVREEASDGN